MKANGLFLILKSKLIFIQLSTCSRTLMQNAQITMRNKSLNTVILNLFQDLTYDRQMLNQVQHDETREAAEAKPFN